MDESQAAFRTARSAFWQRILRGLLMTDGKLLRQAGVAPSAIQQGQTLLGSVQLLELETHERRFRNRYPVRLEVEYIMFDRGHVVRFGSGTTVNVSSNGILFEAEDALQAGRSVKLAIKWPFLLEGICSLKLHIRGTIVRCDTNKIAVQIAKHEFRTVGIRSPGAGSTR